MQPDVSVVIVTWNGRQHLDICLAAVAAQTKRLRIRYIESGPADGIPVVMIHGNLSTGRFFEHLMPGAPKNYRIIAPDMRAFGDTERKPMDATRGLRDWAGES